MRRQGKGPSRRERKKAEIERPKPHSCDAVMRLQRIAILCGQLGAAGQQHVLIGRVLEIADPEHRYVPALPPGADPVFGTLPVTAPPPEDD